MADNPTLQNWQGRQYESFGKLRIDTGNPELGNDGATTYALYAENDQGLTSSLIMSEGGQYNILNDECITIIGGIKKEGEGACINIIGKEGDVCITAEKSGKIKIKGNNIVIDSDKSLTIKTGDSMKLEANSIFFDCNNLATNALTGNLAPRDVTFGGLCFRGQKVGIDKIASSFTGGGFDSLANQAQDIAKDASKQLSDMAGKIDTEKLAAGAEQASTQLNNALANFKGFG